ncbi:hypothetical protein OIU77_003858 [Salix suchowensis]|uniref:Ribosomal protein S21e n=1 Tax=Salix suchowensis TaxID=1278906 RepID=A0ABQ9ATV5_9ROSI|nr:hypothetical protein OIU77_003858 [Salix suchowensis]
MQNDEGQNMDLYIPRKCSATNRLITSKDHASVQINIGHLDASGHYTGQFTTFALCAHLSSAIASAVDSVRYGLMSVDLKFRSTEIGSVWTCVDVVVLALEHEFYGLRFYSRKELMTMLRGPSLTFSFNLIAYQFLCWIV